MHTVSPHHDPRLLPPAEGLTVQLRDDGAGSGDQRRVRLLGELDLATAPLLESRLLALVDDGCRQLDLDLSEMSFCDVAGLTALLRARDALGEHGGRIVLRQPSPSLRRLLGVLRLSDTLEPAETDPDGRSS